MKTIEQIKDRIKFLKLAQVLGAAAHDAIKDDSNAEDFCFDLKLSMVITDTVIRELEWVIDQREKAQAETKVEENTQSVH